MKTNILALALVALLLVLAATGAYVFSRGSDGDGFGGRVAPLIAAGNDPASDVVSGEITGNASTGDETMPIVPDETGAKTAAADPGTQSSLSELAATLAASGPEAARQFASERNLKYENGRVQLVVEAGDAVTAAAAVAAAGGVVETTHENLIQAEVPVDQIASLATAPSITYIREPQTPSLASISEGVADIGAPVWHAAGGNGAGVKVAVIDLGFQGYQGLVTAGELPANVTVASFRTDGDITGGGEKHGSACAEVVYDVAPGAQLYLVNFTTDVELANAIDYVIAQDIDVVSASWSFFGNFRGDGQGPIDDMVQGAHDSGVFWASVAGNAAQDHWGGVFSDTNSDSWHEFAAGDDGNDITATAGTRINVYLSWDKWPVTDQDYDMYLVYEGNPGTAVAASDGYQGGTQAPAEQIHYTVPAGKGGRYWVSIRNYSATGDANFKLYTYPLHLQYQTPAGSLGGQPTDSPYVMTVGAVQVNTFSLESFSSRGPTVDGRTKPDIAGPDRITTTSFGGTGFWGTSAAAPHVAGAGALVVQAHPAYNPDQIQSFLETRATDLGVPGKDNLFGSGKLNLGAIPDLVAPQVTSVLPAGFVDATAATISVDFTDSGSGIDTAAVTVTLDGITLAGCTVTAGNASCPVSGLVGGTHNIGGSVGDIDGNSAPISGSFYVTCFQPALAIGSPQPSWATFQDYLNRELTISYSLCNTGANDAYNVNTVGAVSTNGVVLLAGMPAVVGDIQRAGQPASCTQVTFKYLVPHGVELFKTVTYVTAVGPCGGNYAYPGPYIGPGG